MTPQARGRPVLGVLLSAVGLAVWAGHFTAIYAATAVACERGLVGRELLGLPWVAALVGLATLVALAVLGWTLWAAVARLGPPVFEGNEAEPRFSTWFSAATAALAALAVVFQATPVLLLPGCG